MSRLGKLAIAVPESVNVGLTPSAVTVKGAKGELSTFITGDVKVAFNDGKITVLPANDSKHAKAMWGTLRSNINNIVVGVTDGFEKNLELRGVGYRCALANNILTLFLGYSHEIKYVVPEGISMAVEKQTSLKISGIDKQKVSQVAAEIRSLRKPEPYKGKGVRYVGEYVRIKEGKKK